MSKRIPERGSSDVAVATLEERIGYRFQDRAKARLALTHRSLGGAVGEVSYERLEFLGDAVLGLVAADWLYETRPAPEGVLARIKSFLVSARALAPFGQELGLGELLVMGESEERSGGRHKRSLLADATEAVIGAVYLDGGLEPVKALLVPYLERLLSQEPELAQQDAKTRLQELLQGRAEPLPEYVVVERTGPAHDQRFEVECRIAGETLGRGRGKSKKTAERKAAAAALSALSALAAG